MTQGAHNLSEAKRRAAGRKGGSAEVPKGFALMDADRRHAAAVKGGLARQHQIREQRRVSAA